MPVDRKVRLVLALILFALVSTARADGNRDKQPESKFLRMTRTAAGEPLALEAAIVRYGPIDSGKTAPTVDLVAAVHVGDSGYYQELNRRFGDYDVVLYELVAPKGTRVPKGGARTGGSPVSMLQLMMTRALELEFQLNGVDYTVGNFVHADMTPDQFAETMRQRGESVFQIFFRMMGHAMAKQNDASSGGGDFRLLAAMFNRDRALAMKRVLAEQFRDLEGSLAAINGPDGSTLITERNKVALEVLREQLESGQKKLAIFYGAGHMFDFEERLRVDFGLAPLETIWLTAWNLADSQGAPEEADSAANGRASSR